MTLPEYTQGLIRYQFDGGNTLSLTPLECWKLVQSMRAFLDQHSPEFDPPPSLLVTANSRQFSVAMTRNLGFWRSVERGAWEPDTLAILERYVTGDTCYLDVGAWIGPTLLFASQSAKRAYGFEPDPIAFAELETNAMLNKSAPWAGHMRVLNAAIASKSGTLQLGSRAEGGDSTSSILFAEQRTSWSVKALTLTQFLESERLSGEKLFIKMDIEGAEYQLIPTLKELLHGDAISMFLSVHPAFLADTLLAGWKGGLHTKVARRLLFSWRHIRLLLCLVHFKYLYRADGSKLHFGEEFLRTIFMSVTTEILATNEVWDIR